MAILSISTYEPTLTTLSPSAGFILASNPTSPPLPPSQPTPQSSNGGIQPNTIFGIVVGLVGFIILILACSFVSRLPCFRKSEGVRPTSSRPWQNNYIHRELRRTDVPRPRARPSNHHVEPPVVAMFTFTGHRTQPSDHDTYLPPYEYPPPYPGVPQPPQCLHHFPRAVAEAQRA